MQTAVTTLTPKFVQPRCAEVPLVIFSAVDPVWRDCWQVAGNVPVVVVSHRGPEEILAAQRALGVRHPFVCGGGAALYVPSGYFPELTRIGSARDGWNIVDFKAPYDTGHAVRLLASLFRVCNERVVIVGIVDRWDDRVLLHYADVPVVVRSGRIDETRLVESVPAAYVTNTAGAAGWTEAILGTMT